MILINKNLLPEGITYGDLVKIENEILDALKALDYCCPNENVKVEFSNRIRTKKEGYYSFEEAKKKALIALKGCVNLDSGVERMIDAFYKAETIEQAIGIIREIFGRCYGHIEESDIFQKMEDIIDIFDGIYFSCDILGEYTHKSHWVSFDRKIIDESQIILYINNIGKNLKNGETLLNGIKQVMAHEYFHMFHHYISNSRNNYEFDERKDYLSTVVKESLAVLFEKRFGDAFLSGSNNNVFVNPYVGWIYLEKYIKFSKPTYDFLMLDNLISYGMNKWFKEVINNPKLYYKILNKEAISKKTKKSKTKNSKKVKIGAIFDTFDLIELFDKHFNLKPNRYYSDRCFELDNGQYVILNDDKNSINRLIPYINENNIPYLRIVHVFKPLNEGKFQYCGAFRLDKGDDGDYLIREKGEELVYFIKPYLNQHLLSILRKRKNINDDSKFRFYFLIDSYKFPKVNADDNFLTFLDKILKKEDKSYYQMYKDCVLDRDNNKQYFDKKEYEEKKNKSKKDDVLFRVPLNITYKICLGLKLDPKTASYLISLAQRPSTRNEEILGEFVIECLKDKELLKRDDYKEIIDEHLIQEGYGELFYK